LKKLYEEYKVALVNKLEDLDDLDNNVADLIESDFKRKKLKQTNPTMIEEVSDEEN
jgi:hypothetical protein